MKKPLSKLERVPLREAWKHEANDFTPWLAEEDNLNTLADALGLADLELVATEHWVVTPIGRHVLGKPDREDYAIVESKIRRAPSGRIDGYGLMVLPKEKGPNPATQ